MNENTYGVYRVDKPGQIREIIDYHRRKYGEEPAVVVISQTAPDYFAAELTELGMRVTRKANVLPRDIWVQ